MNTQKSVNEKLFKTNLTIHKVELGVAEEISKMAATANAILKELKDDKILLANADKAISDAMTAADKVASNSEKNSQKAGALLPKIGNILDKADKAAKDLGLDSKGITGYSELDNLYFAIEAVQKEVGLNYVFKN